MPDLVNHVTTFHNLGKEDYLKIFPNESGLLEEKTEIDKDEVMKNSEEFFDKFMGDEDLFSDDENAKDNTDNNFDWAPKIISSVSTADDPWYESIRTKCEVCSEILWHGQFIKHIRLTHSMG